MRMARLFSLRAPGFITPGKGISLSLLPPEYAFTSRYRGEHGSSFARSPREEHVQELIAMREKGTEISLQKLLMHYCWKLEVKAAHFTRRDNEHDIMKDTAWPQSYSQRERLWIIFTGAALIYDERRGHGAYLEIIRKLLMILTFEMTYHTSRQYFYLMLIFTFVLILLSRARHAPVRIIHLRAAKID